MNFKPGGYTEIGLHKDEGTQCCGIQYVKYNVTVATSIMLL
jgi:hypothetical protein